MFVCLFDVKPFVVHDFHETEHVEKNQYEKTIAWGFVDATIFQLTSLTRWWLLSFSFYFIRLTHVYNLMHLFSLSVWTDTPIYLLNIMSFFVVVFSVGKFLLVHWKWVEVSNLSWFLMQNYELSPEFEYDYNIHKTSTDKRKTNILSKNGEKKDKTSQELSIQSFFLLI